jgi:hypothetical protein
MLAPQGQKISPTASDFRMMCTGFESDAGFLPKPAMSNPTVKHADGFLSRPTDWGSSMGEC